MTPYLFTTVDGELIEIRRCRGGMSAQVRRVQLKREHGEEIIAWCCMGGDNPSNKLEV